MLILGKSWVRMFLMLWETAWKKIGSFISGGLDKIDGYISEFYKYQSQIEARLQGSEQSYKDILKTVSKILA